MTKEQAIEILGALEWPDDGYHFWANDAADALASAGAFTDGAVLSRLGTWAKTYGAVLCPGSRPDTFGEGMREAKEQVSRILASAAEDKPSRPVATEAGPSDIDLSNIYFRAAGLAPEKSAWLDANGARAIYEAGRASRPVATEAGATLLAVIEGPLRYALGAARRSDDAHAEGAALAAINYAESLALAKPSRPVATEASAHEGSVAIDATETEWTIARQFCVEAFRAGTIAPRQVAALLAGARRGGQSTRPVATGSKARAEEILSETLATAYHGGASALVEALDSAGIFADEATLAEIDEAAREVFANETISARSLEWRTAALRLASAVRKLGIGGGK